MAAAGRKRPLLLLLSITLVLLSLARFVRADQYHRKKPPKKHYRGGYYKGNPVQDDDSGYNPSLPAPVYKLTPIIKPPKRPSYKKQAPKPALPHKPTPIYKAPKSAFPYKKPPKPASPYKPTPPYKPPKVATKPPGKTPPIYKPGPQTRPPSIPMTPPPAPHTPPLYPSPSTPQTPSYTPSSSGSWQSQWLDPHNAARAEVGEPPMVWSDEVAQYAQSWANQRKASGCGLQHSDGPYGENIFWGSGGDYGPAECVAAWVSEKQYYDYADNSCAPGQQCGHYTQVVWASSVHLGCAKVQCDSGQIFMTCNYDPPGNWIGSKPY